MELVVGERLLRLSPLWLDAGYNHKGKSRDCVERTLGLTAEVLRPWGGGMGAKVKSVGGQALSITVRLARRLEEDDVIPLYARYILIPSLRNFGPQALCLFLAGPHGLHALPEAHKL